MAKVTMYKSGTEKVATLSGVRDACRDVGSEGFLKAQSGLAAHRDSGNATIEITDTDYYPNWGVTVSLIDNKVPGQGGPGALGIEFGHYVNRANGTKVKVEGLKILGTAFGLY